MSYCLRAFASEAHAGEANYPNPQYMFTSLSRVHISDKRTICIVYVLLGLVQNPYFAIKATPARHAPTQLFSRATAHKLAPACAFAERVCSYNVSRVRAAAAVVVEAVIFVHIRCNGKQYTRHRKLYFVIWLNGGLKYVQPY